VGREQLDGSLVRGVLWTAGTKGLSQLLSWGATLLVVRLLTPQDFGVVGMATTYLFLVQLLSEFGLSTVIIQQRDLGREKVAQLGGVSVSLGVVYFLASIIVARPVAAFYGVPAVRWVLIALSTTFLAGGLQILPRSLLTRDLEFRRLAAIEFSEAIALAGGALILAYAGYGYWSLVWSAIAGKVVSTILALVWKPHGIALPRRLGDVRPELTLGAHILVATLGWYVYSNADFVVVGRFLGSASLGAYTLAWTLGSVPVDRMSDVVSRVTPAIFSAVQTDLPALRRYLSGALEGIGLLILPASVGLALVADDFIVVVLGERWRAAIVPLRLLALAAVSRSLTPVVSQVLVATGRAALRMKLSVTFAVVFPVLFALTARWGPAGVAAVWLVAHPILVLGSTLVFGLPSIQMRIGEFVRALLPAIVATAAMAVLVTVFRVFVSAAWRPSVRLPAAVVLGAGVYILLLHTFHRERLWRFVRAIRGAGTVPA
jgi:PST family polysaccharide transporter